MKKSIILSVAAAVLCVPAWAADAESAAPAAGAPPAVAASVVAGVPEANAAGLYRQAFGKVTDEIRKAAVLGAPGDMVPENAEQLLDENAELIALIRKAALTSSCNWGSRIEDGPAMQLPYLGEMRTLARLMILQFRIDVSDRNADMIVKDLQVLDGLARHANGDKLLICLLVKRAIQFMVIKDAAFALPSLPDPALKTLEQLFPETPAGGTRELAEAMRSESMMSAWLRRRLEAAVESPGKAEDVWKELNRMIGNELSGNGATPDPKQILAWCDELDRFQAELVRVCNLPDAEITNAVKRVQDQAANGNPLLRMLAPAVASLARREVQFGVQAAMLRAAIGLERVRRTGKPVAEAVAATRDPSGIGPFRYQAQPSGKTYLLSAAFEEKPGKPVTLEVGTDAAGK